MAPAAGRLGIRIEAGVPKLLVKVSPQEAQALSLQNLGEVMLRKGAASRGQVAVLHVSRHVGPGEILVSLKLADLLDVEEGDLVDVTGAQGHTSSARDHERDRGAAATRHSALLPPRLSGESGGLRSASGFSGVGHGHLPDPGHDARRWQPSLGQQPPLWTRGSGKSSLLREMVIGHEGVARRGTGCSGGVPPSRHAGAVAHSVVEEGLQGRVPPDVNALLRSRRSPEREGGAPDFDFGFGAPGSPSKADDRGCGHEQWAAVGSRWPGDERVSHGGSGVNRQAVQAESHGHGREQWAAAGGGQRPARHSCGGAPDWDDEATSQFFCRPFGGRGGAPEEDASLLSSRLGDRLGTFQGPAWRSHQADRAAGSWQPPEDQLVDSAGTVLSPQWAKRNVTSPVHTSTPPVAKECSHFDSREDLLEEVYDGAPTATAWCRVGAPLPPEDSPSRLGAHANRRRVDAAGSPGAVPTGCFGSVHGVDLFGGLAVAEEPVGDALSPTSSPRASSRPSSGASPKQQSASPLGGLAHSERGRGGDEPPTTACEEVETRGPSVGSTTREASSSERTSVSPRGGGTCQRQRPSALLEEEISGGGGSCSGQHAGSCIARTSLPLTLAVCPEVSPSNSTTVAAPTALPRQRGGPLWKRRSSTLGALQPEAPLLQQPEPRGRVPESWRPPRDTGSCGLERSELGGEATVELRRWLSGEISGSQCSQVILDRALTVLSNFKLASGCHLEVLGGPLGAIVGGYSDADWLYDEFFKKEPAEAVSEAFRLFGFGAAQEGDWSAVGVEEVSLVYRRMCLRGHPSRGGSPRDYLQLQVAMELVRAFCGEATQPSSSSAPDGYLLTDLALIRELRLTAAEAEAEAQSTPQEELEEMNRALDEYILRQMCFKSEIVDEIARLHEDSAYAILGVCSDATDEEIKKAYRVIARECHPDKGGDKEDFQELTNAYEKIMEQRRSALGKDKIGKSNFEEEEPPAAASEKRDAANQKRKRASRQREPPDTKSNDADKSAGEADNDGEEGVQEGAETAEETESVAGDLDGEPGEGRHGAEHIEAVLQKSARAAEEASRYAKTSVEFAQQAAQAAEEARQDMERGSRGSLTKSVAHSAIVCTLTVVKAVRAVGYATLDAAAQCRIAAKKHPAAVSCAEQAVASMSLGLDALNASLACAEVTEITAAELQAPADASQPDSEAAERYAGAATKASMAAANASGAAMAAAHAAMEGHRQCVKALKARAPEAEDGHDVPADGQEEAEDAEDAADAFGAPTGEAPPEAPRRPPPPTAREMAAVALQRLVTQRNNNHKVLQRLNAEILGHQKNVRQFLQANRQLIPSVSGEAKQKVFRLARDFAAEALADLRAMLWQSQNHRASSAEKVPACVARLPLLVPFLQRQSLAIPVCVKARVLKMAALYDLPLTMRVLDEEIFAPASAFVPPTEAAHARRELESLCEGVRRELCANVAEEGAECAGVQTPSAGTGQTPCNLGGQSGKSGGGRTPTRFGV